MMTPASLGTCWANVPSHLVDDGKRCHSRVDPRDPLGLCPACKRRLRDESQVSEPTVRVTTDRPNSTEGRRWAREAGLL